MIEVPDTAVGATATAAACTGASSSGSWVAGAAVRPAGPAKSAAWTWGAPSTGTPEVIGSVWIGPSMTEVENVTTSMPGTTVRLKVICDDNDGDAADPAATIPLAVHVTVSLPSVPGVTKHSLPIGVAWAPCEIWTTTTGAKLEAAPVLLAHTVTTLGVMPARSAGETVS